jgi:hypothetical protein
VRPYLLLGVNDGRLAAACGRSGTLPLLRGGGGKHHAAAPDGTTLCHKSNLRHWARGGLADFATCPRGQGSSGGNVPPAFFGRLPWLQATPAWHNTVAVAPQLLGPVGPQPHAPTREAPP